MREERLDKPQSLMSKLLKPQYLMVYATVGIFILIYLYGSFRFGKFGNNDIGFNSLRTFVNMFKDNAYYGISAVGMTMVLITGGIDLSVASIACLTGMIVAYGNTVLGIHPAIGILIALVIGVGLGLLQGAAIHYLGLPAFIVTLAGNFLARGVCSLISRESISISHPMIDSLAGWKWYFKKYVDGEWVKIKPIAFINLNLLVFIVMIIVGTVLLRNTKFGRNIYAIGGNAQSAKLMGLPVGKTIVAVYGFNGFCSVLAGLAYLLEVKSGWNLALNGGELEAITCAVIGGTLLTGGVGYMIGTLFGVLLKSVIPALITFNGNLLSWWGKIATGGLLALFIVIQRIVVTSSETKNSKTAKKKA